MVEQDALVSRMTRDTGREGLGCIRNIISSHHIGGGGDEERNCGPL